ncbi:hypothetical protein [Xylocopilactobacillus apis]|uniref:Uncharacterized protein n=1 Tax=Xylocopilactobacillus apis TaxID=2932183 RepID=A0AAU9D2Y4_9LACO|nr:hypothetical protein [Xylocopilactobacillus apis]BDR56861.1 hypothetical protein KIMC2_14230 [Xylocopilactobacillus apis]
MSIKGKSGQLISYDSEYLIDLLENEVRKGLKWAIGYYDWADGVKIYKDFDYTINPDPGKGKKYYGQDQLASKDLLSYLIKQNKKDI